VIATRLDSLLSAFPGIHADEDQIEKQQSQGTAHGRELASAVAASDQ